MSSLSNIKRIANEQIKEASEDELNECLYELKKKQFNLRFAVASGTLKDTSEIRKTKKNLARVKTKLGKLRSDQFRTENTSSQKGKDMMHREYEAMFSGICNVLSVTTKIHKAKLLSIDIDKYNKLNDSGILFSKQQPKILKRVDYLYDIRIMLSICYSEDSVVARQVKRKVDALNGSSIYELLMKSELDRVKYYLESVIGGPLLNGQGSKK